MQSTMQDDQLQSSAAAYARWITALMDYIKSNGASSSILELNPNECEIGRWLNSQKSNLKDLEEYSQFYEAHLKLHQYAMKIVEFVDQGDQSSAYQAMSPGGEFSTISRRLIMDLDHLIERAAKIPR